MHTSDTLSLLHNFTDTPEDKDVIPLNFLQHITPNYIEHSYSHFVENLYHPNHPNQSQKFLLVRLEPQQLQSLQLYNLDNILEV